MKKLYGVLPAIAVQYNRLIERVTAVPSTELLLELSTFPKNTRVAIEEVPPGEELYLGNGAVSVDERVASYFYRLADHCRKYRLQPVFIDDVDMLRKQADHALRVRAAGDKLGRRNTARNQRDFYKAYVDRECFNTIERPQHYLKILRNCDVGLVMSATAEGYVASKSLSVDAYAAETQPAELLVNIEERFSQVTGTCLEAIVVKDVPPNRLVQDPPIGRNVAFRTRMLSRVQNAIRKGRITDGFPDAIGHTDYAVPSRGLFELFFERTQGDSFEAIYHDIHGPTPVVGQFKGDSIYFLRTFEGEALALAQVRGVMEYSARLRKDGTYRGTRTYDGRREPFTMSLMAN